MASLCSSPLSSILHPPPVAKAKTATAPSLFPPTVWGDFFISYYPDQAKIDTWTKKVEDFKEEVKRMLSSARGTTREMTLIDKLQRLGVAYHFENEINGALLRIFDTYTKVDFDDLESVALRFRLLRDGGYFVSSDVFLKFKDENGKFKSSLTSDVRGLLSLYEAAYYGIQGENILDESISFTKGQLSSILTHLENGPLAKQVVHALDFPIRKGTPRLETKFYISVYQEEKKQSNVLLELAKLDFNLLQSLHREELRELTRWQKETGLTDKCPFARDRLVEGYWWVLGAYFEPQYSRARSMLSRMFTLISFMDDIYDAHCTVEELEALTDAIHRWDLKAGDQLPEYLKQFYHVLLNTVDEIEDELKPGEKFYRTEYVKHGYKAATRSYIKETKWHKMDYVPTVEEYLKVALVTAGYLMLSGASFVGMGEEATKDAFDWLKTHPKFVMDSSIVCRLLNDIQSHEFEQSRGHCASAIECYMKENGATRQEACHKLQEMVEIAWKDMNEFYLKTPKFPLPLLMRVFNLTRIIEVIYHYEDGYTHSSLSTKDNVIATVVDPIPF